MADGFVEMTPQKLQTHEGVADLNRMINALFDNMGGDGDTRRVYSGVGPPLNVVSAGVGSIYMRTDGAAGTSIYIKESGTDATGWTTAVKPNISFSVHKDGTDQTAVVSGANTKVTWSTEEFDNGTYFASSTFTPLFAGRYFISGQIRYTASTDQGAYQIKLYKNGSEYKTSLARGSGTGSLVVDIQVVVDMNGTTDYLEIYARHDSGSDKTIDGSSDRSWFTGSIL